MTSALLAAGVAVAAALIGLLLATVAAERMGHGFRIWPTPGAGSWQSYAFWPLFRGLNMLCVAVALADVLAGTAGPALGLPMWLRVPAGGLLVLSVAIFVYAFRILGRDNSYGAQEGLVTGGIYQWSRNPQNAMLMLVYGFLALAADRAPVYLLCAAMIAVYWLMVLAEEPWLARIYGAPYRDYCRTVPRFFNVRRVMGR